MDGPLRIQESAKVTLARFRCPKSLPDPVHNLPRKVLLRPLWVEKHFPNDRPSRGPKCPKSRTNPLEIVKKCRNSTNLNEKTDFLHFFHFLAKNRQKPARQSDFGPKRKKTRFFDTKISWKNRKKVEFSKKATVLKLAPKPRRWTKKCSREPNIVPFRTFSNGRLFFYQNFSTLDRPGHFLPHIDVIQCTYMTTSSTNKSYGHTTFVSAG